MGRSAVDAAPALPRFGSCPCHRVRAQERGALRRSGCGSQRHHGAVEGHDQDLVPRRAPSLWRVRGRGPGVPCGDTSAAGGGTATPPSPARRPGGGRRTCGSWSRGRDPSRGAVDIPAPARRERVPQPPPLRLQPAEHSSDLSLRLSADPAPSGQAQPAASIDHQPGRNEQEHTRHLESADACGTDRAGAGRQACGRRLRLRGADAGTAGGGGSSIGSWAEARTHAGRTLPRRGGYDGVCETEAWRLDSPPRRAGPRTRVVIHDPAERRSPTAAASSTRFGRRALLSSRASWTRSGTASRRPAPRAQRAKRMARRQAANMLVERCQLVRDDEHSVGLADPLLVTCLRAPLDLGELIVPLVAGAICVLRRADVARRGATAGRSLRRLDRAWENATGGSLPGHDLQSACGERGYATSIPRPPGSLRPFHRRHARTLGLRLRAGINCPLVSGHERSLRACPSLVMKGSPVRVRASALRQD